MNTEGCFKFFRFLYFSSSDGQKVMVGAESGSVLVLVFLIFVRFFISFSFAGAISGFHWVIREARSPNLKKNENFKFSS